MYFGDLSDIWINMLKFCSVFAILFQEDGFLSELRRSKISLWDFSGLPDKLDPKICTMAELLIDGSFPLSNYRHSENSYK